MGLFLWRFTNICLMVFSDVSHFTPNELGFGWNYTSFFSKLFLCNYLCTVFIYWTRGWNFIPEIVLYPKMLFQTLSILILPWTWWCSYNSFFFFSCQVSVRFSLILWTFTLKITLKILEWECFVFCLLGFS